VGGHLNSLRSETAKAWGYDFAVVGLGYVGLPLLVKAAKAGLKVIGFDISESNLNQITSGGSALHDVSRSDLDFLRSSGSLLTSVPELLTQACLIAVCVPTPVKEGHIPDLSFVLEAATVIGQHLIAGQTIVLESTVAPGTTEGPFREALERSRSLVAGTDFHLAYSPERIDPGNTDFGLTNTPKIVGGLTNTCVEAVIRVYQRFVSNLEIAKGTREAEAAKLLENTYRHVNIALINEFALACKALEIDVFDVIGLAGTKPFGFAKFFPSAGAGGHCIPVDPNYFSHALQTETGSGLQFIELANRVNDEMPMKFGSFCIDALLKLGKAPKASRVLVMGLSYKPNIRDVRESSAFGLIQFLQKQGVRVEIFDPLVEVDALDSEYRELVVYDAFDSMQNADLIIFLQAHEAFDELKETLGNLSWKIASPLGPDKIKSSFGF
jgi:UDP-N-acetyl-D-glucosamine dehydrogenase